MGTPGAERGSSAKAIAKAEPTSASSRALALSIAGSDSVPATSARCAVACRPASPSSASSTATTDRNAYSPNSAGPRPRAIRRLVASASSLPRSSAPSLIALPRVASLASLDTALPLVGEQRHPGAAEARTRRGAGRRQVAPAAPVLDALQLAVQETAREIVVAARAAAGDLDVAVAARGPGPAAADAALDLRMVRGALDRVRDRGQEHVGGGAPQVLGGGEQVRLLLTVVAEHQEHAHLDAAPLQQPRGALDPLDRDAAVHQVQHPLRSALRADPEPEAAHPGERVRDVVVDPVGARDALEGHPQRAPLQLRSVRQHESFVDREDVVDVPEHVGPVALDDVL